MTDSAHFSLPISGMTCAACSTRLEKVLGKVEGVSLARVNLATETADILGESDLLGREALEKAVEKAGFAVSEPKDIENSGGWDRDKLVLGLCILLTTPLVLPMVSLLAGEHWMLPGWIQVMLAAPVQILGGAMFYRAAWGAVRNFAGNMDLLVAVGTTAAFGLSLYELSMGRMDLLYFEASAAVITLVRLGKWLEARARKGATDAIRALTALRPDTARVLLDGLEQDVPIAQLRTGDKVRIKAGERLPVDGIVLEGLSSVDQSMLTGENLPVSIEPGSEVIGGTLNGEGLITVETRATGDHSLLGRIIARVHDAQMAKPPIQKLVDRISEIFVPVVLLISLVTALAWMMAGAMPEAALINAISVLVIACPCALGLATPAAIIAGTGVAARHGILIKDASALEMAFRINTIVFDKTGTLTQGKPSIALQVNAEGFDGAENLSLAGQAQSGSTHPLANAFPVVQGQTPDAFENIPGQGISVVVADNIILLGTLALLERHGLTVPTEMREKAEAFAREGLTPVWMARNGSFAALFGLKDSLKPESADVIRQLGARDIEPVMLTGDRTATAEQIAAEARISKVIAEVLPDGKADVIDGLVAEGRLVAMAGDGINDAPALASAHVGIAMGQGSDVALESADIALLGGDLSKLAAALDISRKTYQKIRQNLFWAFVYNVIALPAAALGYLNPVIAGAAMAFSSVCVVSNALLLKRWAPSSKQD